MIVQMRTRSDAHQPFKEVNNSVDDDSSIQTCFLLLIILEPVVYGHGAAISPGLYVIYAE